VDAQDRATPYEAIAMSIRDRLGFDAGGMGVEDALAWAARAGFHAACGHAA